MNAKEEITKLIMASYDQGVADAKQEALAALEQIVAAARADEREECAKVASLVAREMDDTNGTATYIATAIRARGNHCADH